MIPTVVVDLLANSEGKNEVPFPALWLGELAHPSIFWEIHPFYK